MVDVTYSHREGNNPELIHFTESNITVERVSEIITNYPWKSELEWFEKLGEGGGIYFLLGNLDDEAHAYYQFAPVALNEGFLTLDIMLKKGFLGFWGRKAKDVNFDVVSIKEATSKVQELFLYSIPVLYEKYKNK